MTDVIVHIGPHKTGTTAIQAYLSDNRTALLAAGIDFPELGRRPVGAPGSKAHRYFSACMRGIAQECPDGFERECRKGISTAPHCILSSEDFYFGSRPATIARLCYLVPGIARIAYVHRDPVDHLRLLYGEALKGRETRGLGDFVESYLINIRRPKTRFSYYRVEENLRHWAAVAPVTELACDPARDILTDFLNAALPEMDIGPDIELSGGPLSGRINAAASPTVQALHRSLNRARAAGRLGLNKALRLKAHLATDDTGPLEQRYADRLIRVSTPTRRFVKVFRRHNPRLGWLCDHAPDSLVAWELSADLDDAVVADMLDTWPPVRPASRRFCLWPWAPRGTGKTTTDLKQRKMMG